MQATSRAESHECVAGAGLGGYDLFIFDRS